MSRVHIHSSFIHIVNIVYISQHFPIYQWYNMIMSMVLFVISSTLG